MEEDANRDTNREKTDIVAVSPITGAELTRADSTKGGKQKSERKTIANRLKGRKYCNKSCVLWECPYAPLSFSKELNGKCALKQMPYTVQRKIVRLYLNGEKGIIEELREVLAEICQKVASGEDANLLRGYYRDVQDYIKIVYGEKTRLAADIKQEQKLSTKEMMKIIKRAIDENKSENKT